MAYEFIDGNKKYTRCKTNVFFATLYLVFPIKKIPIFMMTPSPKKNCFPTYGVVLTVSFDFRNTADNHTDLGRHETVGAHQKRREYDYNYNSTYVVISLSDVRRSSRTPGSLLDEWIFTRRFSSVSPLPTRVDNVASVRWFFSWTW